MVKQGRKKKNKRIQSKPPLIFLPRAPSVLIFFFKRIELTPDGRLLELEELVPDEPDDEAGLPHGGVAEQNELEVVDSAVACRRSSSAWCHIGGCHDYYCFIDDFVYRKQ